MWCVISQKRYNESEVSSGGGDQDFIESFLLPRLNSGAGGERETTTQRKGLSVSVASRTGGSEARRVLSGKIEGKKPVLYLIALGDHKAGEG